MQAHAHSGSKRRRFFHKYGPLLFVALCVLAIMAFVGLLMYMLTSINWAVRS